jgi:hypothetical protein
MFGFSSFSATSFSSLSNGYLYVGATALVGAKADVTYSGRAIIFGNANVTAFGGIVNFADASVTGIATVTVNGGIVNFGDAAITAEALVTALGSRIQFFSGAITGDLIEIIGHKTFGVASVTVDGGSAASVYLISQTLDGGGA